MSVVVPLVMATVCRSYDRSPLLTMVLELMVLSGTTIVTVAPAVPVTPPSDVALATSVTTEPSESEGTFQVPV